MIPEKTHRLLEQLATLKAQTNGHVLSPWVRTFHRVGTAAHCETCWRMAVVLVDVTTGPITNGRVIEEVCPK